MAAKDVVVLVDPDTTSWASWNVYAEEFAAATGATVVHAPEGTATGPAFFDHVRKLRRPVLNNPKGQTAPTPPDLARRPVVDPAPFWTWSLVARRDETRTAVRATIEVLTRDVGRLDLDSGEAWLPADDPHIAATAPKA